jgi:N-acetyl-1-D-myo-inositol-2-amino-2-deoxy-alpha-D-glucopyranoside deacetylase
MNNPGVLVFFGAHPDDESFGPGATLALYALRGLKVYYVCSTQGESGTVDPELLQGYSSIGDLRWNELKKAARVLGLADIIYLGYRDSGVSGSNNNNHPDALTRASVDQIAGKMVKIIRELKPDIVLTHDPGGGYFHPDHTATHHAAVKAFYAACDPLLFPEAGVPHLASKLYFATVHHGFTRLMIKIMPIMGQDPHHFGRNKDIDITKMMKTDYPVHAVIRPTREALARQSRAISCHISQRASAPDTSSSLFKIVNLLHRRKDYFTRDYPLPRRTTEKDLFDGITRKVDK